MSRKIGLPGAATLGVVGFLLVGIAMPVVTVPCGSISPAVLETVLGVPSEPAPDMPTSDELTRILSTLARPDIPTAAKSGLVEGGISPKQAVLVDDAFSRARSTGSLPLSFTVTDVKLSGPGLVSAQVAVSGPRTNNFDTPLAFVNQNGWKLERVSALAVLGTVSEPPRDLSGSR